MSQPPGKRQNGAIHSCELQGASVPDGTKPAAQGSALRRASLVPVEKQKRDIQTQLGNFTSMVVTRETEYLSATDGPQR